MESDSRLAPAAPVAPKKKRKIRIPRLKKWTIVRVEWLDAVLHEGPQNSDETEFALARRISVGHLIKHTKDALTIAMEDDRADPGDASDCDNASSIPLGMISSVTILVPKE